MHFQSELSSIVIIVLAALLCGLICTRLRLPAIVGYIIAGITLGPSGLALVEDRGQIGVVAELGVLLLLYTIGMQLSLRGFRAIWKVALGTALLQIAAAVGVMLLLGLAFNWSIGVSLLLGFVIALSSTVVALRMLSDLNLLRTQIGQITVSILIAQDLAVIPMILFVQLLAGNDVGAWDFTRILLAVAFMVSLCWYLSRRKRIHLPLSGLLVRQVDLRPIYGVGACFGAAAVTGALHFSPAYGAFLAGLLVGNSTARNLMLRSVQPIQDLLVMAFFLSIGLLVDLQFIWDNIGTVIVLVLLVTVVKTLFNIGVIRLLGEPWPQAFIAGLLIAQIGEFSFLVGETGVDVGLISAQERDLIVAIAVITLLISPIWLTTARGVVRIAFGREQTWREIAHRFGESGLHDLIVAMRKRSPSERLAQRYFGRPGGHLGRGVLAEREAAEAHSPESASVAPQDVPNETAPAPDSEKVDAAG